jgi:hypothetical protein
MKKRESLRSSFVILEGKQNNLKYLNIRRGFVKKKYLHSRAPFIAGFERRCDHNLMMYSTLAS